MSTPAMTTPTSERAPAAAWWTMVVLMLLALYTIADRPMINLQVEPLRKELGLSDFQVGLVQGVSVALFAAFVGYPIAWLADRFDRRLVLAVSMGVWCVSLGLAGLARSFEELFLASAMVGAGEAALLPIALALIPELFRGSQRHLANSVMLVGTRLGVGFVIALCGWLVVSADAWRPLLPEALQALSTWRLSLMAIALPGVVLVPMILMLPRPGHTVAVMAREAGPPVWPYLMRQRQALTSLYLGVGLQAFALGCVLNFAPVVAMRTLGATALQTGNAMGTATLAATLAGFVIAQGLVRLLSARVGPRLAPLALVVMAAGAALLSCGILWAGTPAQLFTGVGLMLCAVMTGTLLYPTMLQDLAPAPMRARLAAVAVTINVVLGSLGPASVGALSDQLKGRPDGLLLAMVILAVSALAASALILLPLVARYPDAVAAAARPQQPNA